MNARELMKKSGLTTLVGANLSGADLSRADLRGADLYGADLSGANLRGADLSGADLSGADLSRADLSRANLSRADLSRSNLSRADLNGADLSGANLSGADSSGADLYGADLRGADLSGADLYGADLYGADLRGADLSGAKNVPEFFEYTSRIVPEGSFVGWKKCQHNILVKVFIPAEARRSNATGRKCRAEFVDVMKVVDGYGKEVEVGVSIYDPNVMYRVGQRVTCDKWNEDRWQECGGGIHFFITRWEAERYS